MSSYEYWLGVAMGINFVFAVEHYWRKFKGEG